MRTKNKIKFDLQDLKINTFGGRMKTKLEMNLTKLGKAGAQLLVLSFLVLSACTKTIPTTQADPIPDPVSAKSNLLGERLFSSSTQNVSMTSEEARPYSSSDNKRVRLELTKDFLRVIETERDARFQSNKANDKLVLEIPVEHYQIECVKDKYGECTNTQAEAKDIPWDQMKNVKIKFSEMKMAQLDFLPILVSQTYGEDCYEETAAPRLVNAQIDADSMNWDVERTFKTKIQCVNELDLVADATVVAVFHYSMVKVDKVITPDYQVVSYPESSEDEKTFGFFSTKRTTLAVDNNKTQTTAVQIMNRWNPNRTKIDYYLSDEFGKPENKMVRDLTYETVDHLNQGLKEAGVNFTIDLHDPAGKNPGDIRNSMIVLVEDPVNSGVIGYGPQTEDPVTGEIVSARTIMFLGTIKQGVWATYEQIRRELQADAENAKKVQAAEAKSKYQLSSQLQMMAAAQKSTGRAMGIGQFSNQLNALIAAKKPIVQTKSGKAAAKAKAAIPTAGQVTSLNLAQIKKDVKKYTARTNPEFTGTSYLAKLKYLHEAKNCALVPGSNYAGGISPALKAQFSLDSKPWKELSEKEKQRVMDIILPTTWVATLIHEMGHNLGLRHNFQGSEDKANFLSIEELQAKGIDHAIPFSSVMEYGDDLKALPYLGKYDIAALKFGYSRTVEVKQADGKFVDTPIAAPTLQAFKDTHQGSETKDYGYCTDEHVGINAGCKRFDLGTSYTEIVQNYIKDYEDMHSIRNYRNGRANMSLMGDVSYAARIGSIFRELRVMMEVRERIKYRFRLADDADEWESVDFLKDLNRASMLSGVFLAKVLLVPDQSCAIALASKPNEIIALTPITELSNDAMSCFDVKLNEKYMMVAEAGKPFNSRKDPLNPSAYVDQIDIRGIWADKLMASKYLFNRQIGIFSLDDKVDNFLDVPALRAPIGSAVEGLITNSVVDSVEFKFKDGSKQNFDVSYDLFETQKINEPLSDTISKRLSLDVGGRTQLQKVVAQKFVTGMNDTSGEHPEDQALSLAFMVNRYNVSNGSVDSSVTKSLVVENTRYVATPSNAAASSFIDDVIAVQKIEKLDPKKIQEIATARSKKQPMPETATADEKVVWEMPMETLTAYMYGTIKTIPFYARLLEILPTSNEPAKPVESARWIPSMLD